MVHENKHGDEVAGEYVQLRVVMLDFFQIRQAVKVSGAEIQQIDIYLKIHDELNNIH